MKYLSTQNNEDFANLHWQPFSPVCLRADRQKRQMSAERSPGNKEQPIARGERISEPIIFLFSEIGKS